MVENLTCFLFCFMIDVNEVFCILCYIAFVFIANKNLIQSDLSKERAYTLNAQSEQNACSEKVQFHPTQIVFLQPFKLICKLYLESKYLQLLKLQISNYFQITSNQNLALFSSF